MSSTALDLEKIPGWYVEFQAALLRQAPRPGEIDQFTAEGWTDNQQSLKDNLRECLVPPVGKKKLSHLRLLFGTEELTLPATEGKELLSEASDIFNYIDPDFKNYGCNVREKPTKGMAVEVYEIVKDGSFADIFGGFGVNLDRLCLTQEQIKRFVQSGRNMLRTDGYATFFLFKAGKDFFVANVHLYSDGYLTAHVDRFSDDYVWYAVYRHRLVVPQLTLAK